MTRVLFALIGYNRRPEVFRCALSITDAVKGHLLHDVTYDLNIFLDKSSVTEEIKHDFIDFSWNYGKFSITPQKCRLGLKKHVYSIFNDSLDYDFVVILEDDILVSCDFSKYIDCGKVLKAK